MAPKAPPSFSNADYWDDRFRNQTQVFEWLLPESCFDGELEEIKTQNAAPSTQILHIGPGTSMLSFHLKAIMGSEYRIHNVDFSQEAVEWGKSKEKELAQSDDRSSGVPLMEWSQVSLLTLPSILSASPAGSIGLIIDKSTSDAIACGSDVHIRSFRRLDGPAAQTPDQEVVDSTKIHPLHILALNLAVTAAPGARWLTLSYSKDRYPFLPMLFGPFPDKLPDGVPDPALYWKLARKEEIQTEQEVPEKFQKSFDFVYRPVTSHYLYVLERTVLPLETYEVAKLDARAEER